MPTTALPHRRLYRCLVGAAEAREGFKEEVVKNTNGKGRVLFTHQELKAIGSLARDRLRGEVTSGLRDETLGGLLIKVSRANKRLETLATN